MVWFSLLRYFLGFGGGLKLIEGNLMLFTFFMLFSTTILTMFVKESWRHLLYL